MNNQVSIYRILNFFGLAGSFISGALRDLSKGEEHISYDVIPGNGEILVKVRLIRSSETDSIDSLVAFEDKIGHSLGQYIFSINGQGMEETVGSLLLGKKITISVAESCTGGLIGNLLTNVPGSSQYFQGGVIAYSNQAKQDLLNVKGETLERFGAVSNRAAGEMSDGVRNMFKSRLGLAVTGIAGPGGGSVEKPVGTVHIGLSTGKKTFSGKYRFTGTRQVVKQISALMALDWVRRYINEDPFLPGL